jgi:hypothetical protein
VFEVLGKFRKTAAKTGRFFCAIGISKQNNQNHKKSKRYQTVSKSPWHRNGREICAMTKGFLWHKREI